MEWKRERHWIGCLDCGGCSSAAILTKLIELEGSEPDRRKPYLPRTCLVIRAVVEVYGDQTRSVAEVNFGERSFTALPRGEIESVITLNTIVDLLGVR